MPGRLTSPEGIVARATFVRVQNQGRRYRGAHMLVMAAPQVGGPRVGYTVSRRVGHAVTRNRVRRRFREIIRLAPECLRPHTDYVVIALPAAAGCSYALLREELLCLLKRIARTRHAVASPPACSLRSQRTASC